MWTTTLKGITGHKRRFASICLAVVLGVTFLTGTLVLGDTIRGGFDTMFTSANEGTAVVVRNATRIGGDDTGQRGVVDPALVDTVRSVPGVAAAEAVVQAPAQLVGADGSAIGGNGPPTVGATWLEDPALEPYHLVEGRAPVATAGDGPVEVVIDRGAADAGDLPVGAVTTVLTPDQVPVEIVGIAAFGTSDSMAGSTFTGFAAGDAARLLAPSGGASEIRVRAADGVDDATLAAAVGTTVPAGNEAITGAELSAEQLRDIEADVLTLFRTMLLVFAGVALLVAAFSIHNTFSIVAAQRSRESALLRAVGATRAQVLGSVALEAVLVGVLATAVGMGLGVGLATGLRALLDATDVGLPTGPIVMSAAALSAPVVVGLGVTLLAAVGPALQSARVSPLAALRASSVEPARVGRVRTLAGVVIGAAGVVGIVLGARGDGALGLVGLGALASIVAFVLLGPVLARPVGRLLGAPGLALRGVTGQLARENAVRNPRRTAATATALVIGIGVVVVFTVFGSSLRTSVDREVTESFGDTDLVVRSTAFAGSGLPSTLTDGIAAVQGVDTVTALAFGDVRIEGETATATVTDPASLDRVSDLKVVSGSIAGLGARQVAVSETWADDRGLGEGSTVELAFADGSSVPAEIGAVYEARGALGDLVLPRVEWEAHATRALGPQVILVGLADGVALETVEADVSALAATTGAPLVETRDEYVASVGREINQVLTIVYVLLAVAVVIALLGIANTLTLSLHERTRELGVLRAVGQSRRQLRSMVRWESAVVAAFGALAGVGLGTLFGWGLVRSAGQALAIGTVDVPTGQLLLILAVGTGVGVLAAVRPARRASRLQVLDALTAD